MENERERELREELKKIQDSKPRGDSLLKLIKKLQRLQASGPPVQGARSPSTERSEVARLVARYLGITTSGFESATSSTQSLVLRHGSTQLEIRIQEGLLRCCGCAQVMPKELWTAHRTGKCTGQPCELVYILRPQL